MRDMAIDDEKIKPAKPEKRSEQSAETTVQAAAIEAQKAREQDAATELAVANVDAPTAERPEQEPKISMQVEFVDPFDWENPSKSEGLVINPNLETIDVKMDEEKETKGGQIKTGGLASCVGYAIYMPQRKEAFVGHFNELAWPNDSLRFEDKDVKETIMSVGRTWEELHVFIFGGDAWPPSDVLVHEMYNKLSDFAICMGRNRKNRDAPARIFCDTNYIPYGRGVKMTVGPKVEGICIDTSTGRVRLRLARALDKESREELSKSFQVGSQ